MRVLLKQIGAVERARAELGQGIGKGALRDDIGLQRIGIELRDGPAAGGAGGQERGAVRCQLDLGEAACIGARLGLELAVRDRRRAGAGADQQGQRAELPSQIRVARRRQKADQP